MINMSILITVGVALLITVVVYLFRKKKIFKKILFLKKYLVRKINQFSRE